MTNMVDSYKKILSAAGLSDGQTAVYLWLLESGSSSAKAISSKTMIGRALTYKVLDQLIALGLVEKKETSGKVTTFLSLHPQKLWEIASTRKKAAANALENLDSIFPALTSAYNLLLGKPNVQFYDGVDGLKQVYDDILKVGKDILIISSPLGKTDPNILSFIRVQIEKQAKAGIHTRALTPRSQETVTEERAKEDKDNLIERKIVSSEKFPVPAQIIIYGEKVAITNFRENIITVVTDSKYIAETFRIIFEYMWEHS